ncbi:MAG: SDR family oxidoreductase [Flavobacteriales bacterium]
MIKKENMLKDDALKDKIVVITGGGTGLGKSMARTYCNLGAKVVITSRKKEVLDKTTEELKNETGGEILPVECDIRIYEQVENMLKQTIENFGDPDVLVNNAAGNFISPTERLSPKAFQVIIDIVLMGTINCTLAFGKHWINTDKENNNVLSIVTTYAWTGSSYVTPSACGKAGVLSFMRSLAVEWAKYDIRTNAIAPGPFPTKGAWERLLPGKWAEKFNMKNEVPLKRVGEHEELCNLASYLISDYASFINGEVVTIDGGEWLKDAGQFNMFEKVSNDEWDEIEKYVRGQNKS